MEQITVKFSFQEKETQMKCKKNEPIKLVLKRFASQISKSASELFFFYKGENISTNNKEKVSQIQGKDKNFIINVVPMNPDEESKNTDGLKLSSYVICPKCKDDCLLNIKNYKISLNNCYKEHETNEIFLPDFKSTQYIIQSLVKCSLCSSHKGKTLNHRFYTCSCGINLCPSCINKHKMPDHNVIDYDTKSFVCLAHKEKFCAYCVNCTKNLCEICDNEHDQEHRIVYFDEIINNDILDDISDTMKEFKIKMDKVTDEIKNMIEVFNKILETINTFYEINEKIYKNYDKENRNYQIIQNLLKINYNLSEENEVFQDINKILNENKYEKKMKHTFRLYERIYGTDEILGNYDNNEDNTNINLNLNLNNIINKSSKLRSARGGGGSNTKREGHQNIMTIKYSASDDVPKGEIRLFGKEFVRNNKENCIIFVDNEKKELCEFFTYTQDEIDDNLLEVKLLETKPIQDMSYMFANCEALSLLPDFHKWDVSQVREMRYLFSGCCNIVSFPDLSEWDTSNVVNMSYMFSHCESLKMLPDLSKWDVHKVNNMCCMFNHCVSLTKLPDISKWKMNSAINISYMFNGCCSLPSFPDINEWNTNNVTNMSYLFYGCSKLTSLPDINSWNTSKVTNMSGMFFDCQILRCLPDLSEWNTSKVTNMRSMFSGCKEFCFLPDIKKWDISSVVNLNDMFNGCNKLPLKYIPYKFRK